MNGQLNNVQPGNERMCRTPVCSGPGAYVLPLTAVSCGQCGQRPAPTLTCTEFRHSDGWNKRSCPKGQIADHGKAWNAAHNNQAWSNKWEGEQCYTPVCNGPGAYVLPVSATSCGECGQRPPPPMTCLQQRAADGWNVENCPVGMISDHGKAWNVAHNNQ